MRKINESEYGAGSYRNPLKELWYAVAVWPIAGLICMAGAEVYKFFLTIKEMFLQLMSW